MGDALPLPPLCPQVAQRLEEVVQRCPALDLRHFDPGVVKVRLFCKNLKKPF